MNAYAHDIDRLDGSADLLHPLAGTATLMVNVASKCGLTPQYTALQDLQARYGERGFSVVGFPCNQFMGQEPGSAEEIATFCSTEYGVTFPMSAKVDVNGDDQHPLFAELHAVGDAEGYTGDVRWNFEKWLIGADGEVVARFAPQVTPDSDEVTGAIEALLS